MDSKRDSNYVTSLLAVSSVDGITPVPLWADPITHRLLVDAVSVSIRVGSEASSATTTVNMDSYDQWNVTALAVNDTIAAPTGTLADGRRLTLRIKDNGTSRTLAFNAVFRFSSDLPAPTATTISKTLYMGFILFYLLQFLINY